MKNGKWIAAGLASAIGAAAGVAAVRTYQRFTGEMAAVTHKLLTDSQVIDTTCGPVEYAIKGEGNPVLVVHGTGTGYDQGLLINQYSGGGFKGIAMSRFGYLRTPLPESAFPADQADAHAALLDALDIPKAAVIGVSGGGPSSIQFAIRHPDRCSALVLLSAVSQKIPAQDLGPIEFFQWLLKYEFTGWLLVYPLRPLLLAVVGIPPTVWINMSPFEKAWVVRFARGLLPLKTRREGTLNDYIQFTDMAPLPLNQIKSPSMVIHAADDPLVPIAHGHLAASSIPKARLVELPQGGHLLVGHHQTVTRFIKKFLEEHSEKHP